MVEPAIALDNVGYAYRPGAWVFRGYSIALERGRVLALLGPNGRGKTTLLRLMLGALKPTEGRAMLNGAVAFAPQLFQIAFDYTALDMVLMGRARKIGLFSQPTPADLRAALAALDRFGVADLAGRPFHELSGGERQLVIFARAVAAEVDILILDEPTSALDLKNQALILSWIARLSHEGRLTIVMTTHHPDHALAVADEALLMLERERYVAGAARDMLTEDNLTALYGVRMKRLAFELDGAVAESFVPFLTVPTF